MREVHLFKMRKALINIREIAENLARVLEELHLRDSDAIKGLLIPPLPPRRKTRAVRGRSKVRKVSEVIDFNIALVRTAIHRVSRKAAS